MTSLLTHFATSAAYRDRRLSRFCWYADHAAALSHFAEKIKDCRLRISPHHLQA
jgi:hypothetical protein